VRNVPERSPILQIVAVFGGFGLGPWLALQIGRHLAPGSELVHTLGALAFVLVFAGGTLVWAGFGFATVIGSRLFRGRRTDAAVRGSSGRTVPSGYRAYIVLGCGAGVVVGLLTGTVTELTVVAAVAAWTVVGAAYGFLLWAAAHHGYLPFQ